MTPWQLGILAKGEADAIAASYQAGITFAWKTAAFQRSRRLPRLEKLFEKPKPQGIDEQAIRAAFDLITETRAARRKSQLGKSNA